MNEVDFSHCDGFYRSKEKLFSAFLSKEFSDFFLSFNILVKFLIGFYLFIQHELRFAVLQSHPPHTREGIFQENWFSFLVSCNIKFFSAFLFIEFVGNGSWFVAKEGERWVNLMLGIVLVNHMFVFQALEWASGWEMCNCFVTLESVLTN